MLSLLELAAAGARRRVWLQAPTAPEGRLPVLIMLHGAGGTAAVADQQTGWAARAPADGFILALPEGTPRESAAPPAFRLNPQLWNDGSGRGHVARRGVDDVGFIVALIEHLVRESEADRSRVYVTGFSNGASLAFRLAAERPDVITAIAPVAGHCWVEPRPFARAVPLLHIAGAEDPLNPLAGGEVATPWGHSEYHPPIRRSIERWSAACGCGSLQERTDPAGVRWTEGVDCAGKTDVRLAVVPGLGHVWPGGPRLLPEATVGRASQVLPGTPTIWSFFSPLRAPL